MFAKKCFFSFFFISFFQIMHMLQPTRSRSKINYNKIRIDGDYGKS